MKSFHLFWMVFLLSTTVFGQKSNILETQEFHRCYQSQLEEQIRNQNPTQFDIHKANEEQRLQNWIENHYANFKSKRAVITIPVVVQIWESTSTVPDVAVYEQIATLNEDYRRTNSDAGNTPAAFASIAADCEIEFCLATQDPNGNPTTGIIRKTVGGAPSGSGGSDLWDTDSYLNIYVYQGGNLGGGTLGYTYTPSTSTNEAVHINSDYFGTTGASAPFNLGRTATHEVGHWLNLEHVWGPGGGGCSSDDFVSDTPIQSSANYNCPNHPSASCSNGGDMFMNYMDYVNDNCMNAFTEGQKARMIAAINTYRPGLLTSSGCGDPVDYDAAITGINSPTGSYCTDNFTPEVVLTNYGDQTLTSVTINYDIDGGTNNTYPWTGSLSTGSSVTITLSNMNTTDGSHTFNASTSNPNGQSDGTPGNDASSTNFSTAADGTIVDFDFHVDCFGDEITWEIKDENNVLIDDGGPYTVVQGGTQVNESYCLAAGCYDLIIIDTFGDGVNGNGVQGCNTNGNYSITDDEANVLVQMADPDFGFSITESFCIQGCALTITDNISNASCNGLSDGSITISTSGGETPYSYNWSSGENSNSISGKPAGLYTVTVTDNVNCNIVQDFTISEPTALSISLNKNDPSCVASSDGSATASVTGGTLSYSYSWSNGSASASANNLVAGNYQITVMDANNCQLTSNVDIIDPPTITITTNSSNQLCGSNSGSATALGTGGTGTFSYVWSDAQSTNTVTGLTAGNYSVTVTDSNGCEADASISVGASNPALNITTSTSDAFCGSASGTATVNNIDGNAPYNYSWSNSQSTTSATGLLEGNYSITVTDNNGCSGSTNVTVSASTITLNTSVITTDAFCGTNSGTASVTHNNGASPFTYAWSDGQSTQTAVNLSAANYSVSITDINGCVGTNSANITATQLQLDVTVTGSDQICTAQNGTAIAASNNGTGPYSYLWNNGETSSQITGLAQGVYSVTIIDNNTCEGDGNVSVGLSSGNMTLNIATSDQICTAQNGSATAIPLNGATPYQYLWHNNSTTATITGQSIGAVYVTVTDAFGCSATQSSTITHDTGNIGATTSSVDSECGSPTGSATAAGNNGASPYGYLWENGTATATNTGLVPGDYFVTVTDNYGCEVTTSITVGINSTSFNVNVTTTNATCGNANGSALTTYNSLYSYNWSNGSSLNSTTGLSSGVYTVSVTNDLGCLGIGYAQIGNSNGPSITLFPNNLSCNGDNSGLIVSSTTGNNPFTYNWSNGATTSSASGLSAGNYSITVTDVNGCNSVTNASVIEPDALGITVTTTNETNLGDNDGAASSQVSGGTTPYTYSWSNNNQTSSQTGLAPGVYVVTVTDKNGCTTSQSVTISEGLDTGTGISESSNTLNVNLFPNPNDGNFNFVVNQTGNYTIRIVNMVGQEIWNSRLNGDQLVQLNIDESGVYLVQVIGETGRWMERVIIK